MLQAAGAVVDVWGFNCYFAREAPYPATFYTDVAARLHGSNDRATAVRPSWLLAAARWVLGGWCDVSLC
jgi:hypothetical protein